MDVYLSTRRDLLVVKKGCPIPPVATPGSWRKRKKRVVKVSEEIRSALQMQGYYMRKLRDLIVAETSGGTVSRRLRQMCNLYSITTNKKPSARCSAW